MTKGDHPTISTEEELRRERAFFRQVIDLNPSFIFAKDRAGRFTLVNQAVADAYGTKVEDLIGKTDSDFNPNAEEVEHFRKFDLEVMDSKKEIIIAEEMITDSKGNVRWLQTVKRPIIDEDGSANQVLGVATDITARKQAELRLAEVQDELRHSQKMEAIGSLAGGIAHDFNNLLTAIIGFSELLHQSSSNIGEVTRLAELISGAAKRAEDLTSQLLGFARRGKNQDVPVDMHAIIEDAILLLRRTIEKNVTIEKRLNALNPLIKGDPVQMQQVVLNLAINARDAIGDRRDGRLTFETFNEQIEQCDSRGMAGNYLRLLVNDNGSGIDPRIRHRVFEPFFTTKEAGKGTGMGLAMVYGIVHNHGGSITVKSDLGKGACFDILLPLSRSAIASEPVKSDESIVPGHGTVLLVDDESLVREVAGAMLKKLGFTAIVACGGSEAVDIYRSQADQIDLVIIDMNMPGMNGKECFLELKKINPRIRAVLSTGYGLNLEAQNTLNEGFVCFIQKPYRLVELSHVLLKASADT